MENERSARGRRYGGGQRDRSSRGGGRGGSKPQFQRVVPKFLKQYEEMLTGSRRGMREGQEDEDPRVVEESASGGVSGSSGMAGGGSTNGKEGDLEGKGAFAEYDEEEVTALEAYMKSHPSKVEDREALRRRARELSASISKSQSSDSAGEGKSASRPRGQDGSGRREAEHRSSPPNPEPAREYVDSSGRIKFNKRIASEAGAEKAKGAGAAGAGADGDRKKARRGNVNKLSNTKLLSFGDDEDG